jgi:sulfofructose kinase
MFVKIICLCPISNLKQVLLMSRHAEVFGLGQCSFDCIGRVKAYPLPDLKCECSEMVIEGGGPVATALAALSRWGVSCAFAGVVGDDLWGDMIKASLDDEGIDTTGLVVRRESESQFAFIVAEPEQGGRRTIFWRRPTGHPLKPEEIDYTKIRNARVLHTDGLFMEASLAAAKAARAANVSVVVDAGSLREGTLDLARLSDYFIASENFSQSYVGQDGPLNACARLAELGPKVVSVTLGEKGYVALVDGRIIERPAYSVKGVDTTGCGDVFHAGFIYGLVKGWEVDESFNFAAWAASRVALKLGGRAGIPSAGDWSHEVV